MPSGNQLKKSGIDVSRNCSRVLRIHTQRDRRMPSAQGAMRFAWYAILMIPAVVLVEPTGPTTSEMNFSLVKNGTSERGGV